MTAVLDYDREADRYDATRGGVARADAAAAAVLGLVPPAVRTLLDVGCGTGLVTERLRRPGLRVFGADPSAGMARIAADRIPGAVVRADAARLPFATGGLDAVCAIWLLHLLPHAADLIAECARVLTPGGMFVTTVDKDAGHDVGGDIDALIRPFRRTPAFDDADTVVAHGARHGLRPVGRATFVGHGQGRTPARAAALLRAGEYPGAVRVGHTQLALVADRVAALPDPDTARPDPVYRLIVLGRR